MLFGNRRIHPFLLATSWANFFMMPEWLNLLSPSDQWSLYEYPSRPLAAPISVIIVLFFLAFSLWRLLELTNGNRLAETVVRSFMMISLLIPLNRLRDTLNVAHWFPWVSLEKIRQLPVPIISLTLCLAAIGILSIILSKKRSFTRSIDLLFAALTPFILVTFLRVIGSFLNGDLNQIRQTAEFRTPAVDSGLRVGLIIFDELDYRLVFEKRPESLKLPNFDSLVSQSVSFQNAYSPGQNTIIAIPSVTTGHVVSAFEPAGLDNVALGVSDIEVISWRLTKTIFHEMASLNANIALLGWFHGYCRLFGGIVQNCDRRPRLHYAYETDIAANLTPILSRTLPLRWNQEVHIEGYQKLSSSTFQALSDPRYQFVYAHLPVPHFPYIYDAKTEKITRWLDSKPENYFGNVKLADKTIGRFRSEMEKNGTWDQTTLIITSDHHWRNAADYDGTIDLRIPLIIKPAYSKSQTLIKAPASSLGIYGFAPRALMGKSIKPQEIAKAMSATFNPKMLERTLPSVSQLDEH